jgi:hypothetical protein
MISPRDFGGIAGGYFVDPHRLAAKLPGVRGAPANGGREQSSLPPSWLGIKGAKLPTPLPVGIPFRGGLRPFSPSPKKPSPQTPQSPPKPTL